MKLGFAILSHQPPGPMLNKLLTELNEFPDKEIVIHHDFSQTPFDKTLLDNFPIQFTDKYFKTEWAQIGVVQATFECIKKLENVDWIILLSANDYPIKNVESILRFLENTTYNAFIEGAEIVNNKNKEHLLNWVYDKTFKKTLFRIPSFSKKGAFKWRDIRIKKRNHCLNDTFKLYFGSQWFMIDKKVANFLRSIDVDEDPVVKFLSQSKVCKDETIIQTLVHNQPDFKISKENYRYINWDNAKDWHPNILTVKHLPVIKNSKALFARKFNWEESKEILELIDREIFNR